MKSHFSGKTAYTLLLVTAACLGQSRAATFTVTPAVTSNTYGGDLTLQVAGLTNGEPVLVQKFLDANGNGVIDGADVLWQQFNLTDGQAAVFHDGATAVTNFAVPGDRDSTSGQITTAINLRGSGFEQTIAGQYLFALSSPGGNFSPVTNAFALTNFSYAQSFSGTVRANGTNVPGAVILLFAAVGNDMDPKGGAVADNSGNYTINARPGDYLLVAFKNNFVADMGASPSLTLGSGATINTNLNLLSTDRTISGSVVDAGNPAIGLPGLLLPVESSDGLFGIAFTDASGVFTAGVTSNQWKMETGDEGIALHGYLRTQNKLQVNAATGSVAGVTMAFPKATAMFYGSVKDGLNQPFPGINLYSQDDSYQYEQSTASDASGNYFAGATTVTPWTVQVSNDRNPAGYIFSTESFGYSGTNLTAGQALRVDFMALLATNQITGHVQDSNSNPIADVQLNGSATIGGVTFQAQTITDGSGNYSMNVANGDWGVNISCGGGDGSLDGILGPGNYQCPNSQNLTISNNNRVANFNVQPCGGIDIYTSSPLPNGIIGSYYSISFYGSSCSGGLSWSLNSGSLPPGLTLYSGGAVNGTPTTNGTFNFSIHVSDSGSGSTNVNYSLAINPPPPPASLSQTVKAGSQVQFLVSGASGLHYTVQMSTNLTSTNWVSILTTNPPGSSFLVIDTGATNRARFYRVFFGQ